MAPLEEQVPDEIFMDLSLGNIDVAQLHELVLAAITTVFAALVSITELIEYLQNRKREEELSGSR